MEDDWKLKLNKNAARWQNVNSEWQFIFKIYAINTILHWRYLIRDLEVSYPVPVHRFALFFDLFLISLDLPPDCIQEILRAGFLSQPVEAVTTINLKAILWNLQCLRSIMLTAAEWEKNCLLFNVSWGWKNKYRVVKKKLSIQIRDKRRRMGFVHAPPASGPKTRRGIYAVPA